MIERCCCPSNRLELSGGGKCLLLISVILTMLTFRVGLSSGVEREREQLASDVVAIREGADLDLRCPIEVSSDDMIISWTCDNEPANIRSSRIHVTEAGKLRIRAAKIGDACNYRCEAADGYGTLSVVIKVIIVDKKLVEQLKNRTLAGAAQPEVSSTSTSDLNTSSDVKNSSQDAIDVQIEPSLVKVNKNRTFTLECKVRHPSREDNHQSAIRMPQIVWLKEFVGDRPDSLSEAHDRQLIFIDNVYYHSLNWPRSITKSSNKSSTTSSALLIRQSTVDHSGRYICFAGYPPYIMSSRLSSEAPGGMRPSNYKLAAAEVYVNEDDATSGKRQRYSLTGSVASGNWSRNLTIVLVVLCCALYFMRFFYIRWRINRATKDKPNRRPPMTNSSTEASNRQPKLSQIAAIKQQQSLPPLRGAKSTSVPNISASNSLHLIKHMQPDVLQTDLINCNMIDDFSSRDEHLYSEISDRFTVTNNDDSEQEYYKVPVKRARPMS